MNDDINYTELLSRIAAGDKSAESQLIGQFLRGLQYILFRQTRDRELSEDLTQDALMVVLEKAREKKIRTPDALPAYVRQTGVNLLIAYKRSQYSKRSVNNQQFIEGAKGAEQSLLVALSKAQMKDYVHQAVEKLSVERDIEILRRHFIFDQDKSLVCAELNLTPAHYDRVLFRAKARLKKIIEEDKSFDGFDPETNPVLTCLLAALLISAAVAAENIAFTMRDSELLPHLLITSVIRF